MPQILNKHTESKMASVTQFVRDINMFTRRVDIGCTYPCTSMHLCVRFTQIGTCVRECMIIFGSTQQLKLIYTNWTMRSYRLCWSHGIAAKYSGDPNLALWFTQVGMLLHDKHNNKCCCSQVCIVMGREEIQTDMKCYLCHTTATS